MHMDVTHQQNKYVKLYVTGVKLSFQWNIPLWANENVMLPFWSLNEWDLNFIHVASFLENYWTHPYDDHIIHTIIYMINGLILVPLWASSPALQ